MVSIGERLREERETLGWSQEKMAAAAGITKKTQGLYERNERSPSAEYLAALSGYGVDVLYIVTAERKKLPFSCLSPEVTEFLEVYQQVSESDREVLFRTAQAFAKSRGAK